KLSGILYVLSAPHYCSVSGPIRRECRSRDRGNLRQARIGLFHLPRSSVHGTASTRRRNCRKTADQKSESAVRVRNASRRPRPKSFVTSASRRSAYDNIWGRVDGRIDIEAGRAKADSQRASA